MTIQLYAWGGDRFADGAVALNVFPTTLGKICPKVGCVGFGIPNFLNVGFVCDFRLNKCIEVGVSVVC